MSRHGALALVCAVLLGLGLSGPALGAQLPPGFVYLSEVAPDVLQDMRYAGPDNFTGRKVPGYNAPQCILLLEAAEALSRVQAELREQSLGLKVYDCYRPGRATRAFLKWIGDESGQAARATSRIPTRLRCTRRATSRPSSAHSRGIAVDLTLVRLPAAEQPAFDAARSLRPVQRARQWPGAGQRGRYGHGFRLLRRHEPDRVPCRVRGAARHAQAAAHRHAKARLPELLAGMVALLVCHAHARVGARLPDRSAAQRSVNERLLPL